MKYCKQCHTIHSASSENCTQCKKQLKDITEINTPIYLTTACGFDRSRIEGILKDNNIIYSEKPEKDESGAAAIVGSYSENYRIHVPFQAYTAARKLLADIGINTDCNVSEEDIDLSVSTLKAENPQPEPNRAVTATLMFIFLLILAGAVFFTDAVTAWVKSLF